jgi:hypothetical protein
MWTPACRTSNSKIMGINMEMVPPSLFHTDLDNFCMDLTLCPGAFHAKIGKGLPQTVATKLESQNRLECNCML